MVKFLKKIARPVLTVNTIKNNTTTEVNTKEEKKEINSHVESNISEFPNI